MKFESLEEAVVSRAGLPDVYYFILSVQHIDTALLPEIDRASLGAARGRPEQSPRFAPTGLTPIRANKASNWVTVIPRQSSMRAEIPVQHIGSTIRSLLGAARAQRKPFMRGGLL